MEPDNFFDNGQLIMDHSESGGLDHGFIIDHMVINPEELGQKDAGSTIWTTAAASMY